MHRRRADANLFFSFQRRAMSTNCGTPVETYFNYARIITRFRANGDLLAGGTIANSFLLVSFRERVLTCRTMNYDCINNLRRDARPSVRPRSEDDEIRPGKIGQ